MTDRRNFWLTTAIGAVVVLVLIGGYVLADQTLPNRLPAGVVLKGLVVGGLNSLVAAGLILVYRSARVINFAQAGIGGLSAALAVLLVTGPGYSYWLAVPLGLALAAVIGFLIDALVRWRFSRAPRLILTVATIGILQILVAAGIGLPRLFRGNLAPPSAFRTPFSFQFSLSPFVFTGDALIAMIVVPVVLAALYWFLRRTDTGTGIRGMADSHDRAALLGLPVGQLSRVTWIVAALLSAVGAILSQPILGPSISGGLSITALVAPLAAAVLARMSSIPEAFGWSLFIGVLQEAVYWSFHSYVYSEVVLFLVIVVALLFQRRDLAGGDAAYGDYVAVRDVAPVPRAIARLKEVQSGKVVGAVVLVALLVLAPLMLSDSVVNDATYAAIFAIIAVSMVILAGWAGQISLGQFAFVGLGAAAAGALMVHADLPFLVALPVAGLVGAGAAVLIGLPALRIPGLFLAVVTLAFAVPVSDWLLSSEYFPGLDPSQVAPPSIFSRIDLTAFGSRYEVALVVLFAAVVVARNLRRSRTGRAMVAVRDNSIAASAYGISPFKVKLLAFGISGFIAGVAGSLYVVVQGGVGVQAFQPDNSVTVFIMVVIGGLGSLTGGILGAVYVEVVQAALPPALQALFTGAGVLVVLMVFPEGLGGVVFAVRDWIVGQLARAKGLGPDGEPLPELALAPSAAVAPSERDRGDEETEDGAAEARRAALRLRALEELELHGAAPVGGRELPGAGLPADQTPVLDVGGLDVVIGRAKVLFDVTFSVGQSEVVALLGTNGAGKTTVLRAVAGLERAAAGTITFLGEDITGLSPTERVRAGLVTVLGQPRVFPSLSVRENLRLGGWTAHHYLDDPEFASAVTDRVLSMFPMLAERPGQRAGFLSGGEQQMLALAQALMCRPKLLMVDELSLGLAPDAVAQLLEVLRSLARSGVTVMVVEQSVNVATAISSRAIFFERGRVRFSGPTPDLARQPDLLRSVFLRAADRARARRVFGGGPTSPALQIAGPPGPVNEEVVAALTGASRVPAETGGNGVAARVAAVGPTGADEEGEPPPAALAAVGVSKHYGGVAALSDVTVEVAPGEILGIIGANGAGKTTLFDVCSGFVRPETGSVWVDGVDLSSASPSTRARHGLGRVFQDARLWPTMLVEEALATALERSVAVRDPLAEALALAPAVRAEAAIRERVEDLLDELDLARFREQRVGDLSSGTQRVLEVACALAHRPRVLLLDEPTSGIAQREGEALSELLLALREQTGAAFVVIEHDVPVVSAVADRLICLHLGEVIASGTTSEVLNDGAVLQAYLGAERLGARPPAAPSDVAATGAR